MPAFLSRHGNTTRDEVCVCVCVCRAAPVADDSITFLTAVNTAAKLTFIILSSSLTWRHHDTSGDFTAVLQRESPNLSVSRVITAFTPGQHVSRQHVSRTSNLYPDTYMLADTCCRIQVARSGYMLTVSRRHNYYSFMSRSYPATDNFVADTRNMLTATSGYEWIQLIARQHVSWCKRGLTRWPVLRSKGWESRSQYRTRNAL